MLSTSVLNLNNGPQYFNRKFWAFCSFHFTTNFVDGSEIIVESFISTYRYSYQFMDFCGPGIFYLTNLFLLLVSKTYPTADSIIISLNNFEVWIRTVLRNELCTTWRIIQVSFVPNLRLRCASYPWYLSSW